MIRRRPAPPRLWCAGHTFRFLNIFRGFPLDRRPRPRQIGADRNPEPFQMFSFLKPAPRLSAAEAVARVKAGTLTLIDVRDGAEIAATGRLPRQAIDRIGETLHG